MEYVVECYVGWLFCMSSLRFVYYLEEIKELKENDYDRVFEMEQREPWERERRIYQWVRIWIQRDYWYTTQERMHLWLVYCVMVGCRNLMSLLV